MTDPARQRAALRVRLGRAVRRIGRTATFDLARTLEGMRHPSPIDRLHERAIESSADLIEPHLGTVSLFSSRRSLLEFAASLIGARDTGLVLELGTYEGASAQVLVQGLRTRPAGDRLYCFDSFEGLRNSWSEIDVTTGSFDLAGRPPLAGMDRVEPIVGWIEDTLPPFLERHEGPVAFVHFDLDVYEPTREGLRLLEPRLEKGSLLLFDELHGYPGYEHHELRALNETYDPEAYSYLAFGPKQALIELTG